MQLQQWYGAAFYYAPGAHGKPGRWGTSDDVIPYHVAWIYWRAIPTYQARYVMMLARGIGFAFAGKDHEGARAAAELLDEAFPAMPEIKS